MDVVSTAPMVPLGIERWASARSPDLLDPAMIPVKTTIPIRCFYHNFFTLAKKNTCYRREKDGK